MAAALAAVIAVVLSACTVRVDSGGAERSPAPTLSSTSGVVTVPLQIVHQQSATLAIVPVKIDGRGHYPFVLDTGASTSGIAEALAKQLNLPETGQKAQVSGVTGSDQVSLVRIDAWSIAGVALKPTSVGALPFSMGGSGGATGSTASIAGLLGSDQLSRFGAITLDYQHEQLRFTPGRD